MPETREMPSEAEVNKSRTLSDAELLKGGAEYVEGEGQPRLELTSEQIGEVKKELELEENERKLQREKDEEKEKARAEFSEKIESVRKRVDEFIESFPTLDNLTQADIEKLFRMRDLGYTSYDGIGEFALEVGLPIEVTSTYGDKPYSGNKDAIFKGGRFGSVAWYKMDRGVFALIQEVGKEIREKLDKLTLKVANEIMEQGKTEFEEYRMNIEHFLSMFKDLRFERGAFDSLQGRNAEGFEGNSIAVLGNKLRSLVETLKGLSSEEPMYRDFLAQAEFYSGLVDRYVSFEDPKITGYSYRTQGYGNYGQGENVSDAVNFLLSARYWPKFKNKETKQ